MKQGTKVFKGLFINVNHLQLVDIRIPTARLLQSLKLVLIEKNVSPKISLELEILLAKIWMQQVHAYMIEIGRAHV